MIGLLKKITISLACVATLSAYAELTPDGFGQKSSASPATSDTDWTVPAHASTGNFKIYAPDLLFGVYGFAFDYKYSSSVAVGPTFKHYDKPNSSTNKTGNEYGAEMMVSLDEDLNRTGWLLNPYYAHYSGNYDSGSDITTNIFGVNFVHQWIWPSGVNLQAGVGMYYSSEEGDLPLAVNGSHIAPKAQFTVGYAF